VDNIELNLEERTITFRGTYKPTAGPLPTLTYPLRGLWLHEDMPLSIVFEASKVPTHAGELILHKYEGASVVHPGQAKYRYFTVAGLAGMILSPEQLKQAGSIDMFWYLTPNANTRLATEKYPDHPRVDVPDALDNYPPMTLILASPDPLPDDSQGVSNP